MPSWLQKLWWKWFGKPPVPPVPQQPPPPTVPPTPVDPTTAETALVEAGRKLGVRSIVEGKPHATLIHEARQYAVHLASINRQDGHAGFGERYARIRKVLPGHAVAEVTAESWDNDDLGQAAGGMFRDWRSSSDHWQTVNGPAAYYGYSMAKGKSRWYAVGIVVR